MGSSPIIRYYRDLKDHFEIDTETDDEFKKNFKNLFRSKGIDDIFQDLNDIHYHIEESVYRIVQEGYIEYENDGCPSCMNDVIFVVDNDIKKVVMAEECEASDELADIYNFEQELARVVNEKSNGKWRLEKHFGY